MMVIFTSAVLHFFNAGHFFFILLVPALFFALYFLLKNKTTLMQTRILMIIFLANFVLFVTYKIFMWATYDTFEILNELPLQLCNFNVFLLPLALHTKSKFLLNYLYYIGTIGAIAAVVFFDTTFLNKSIFDYGVFIYFFYHSVLLCTGILIPALGIFTPDLKGILKAHGTLAVLGTIMHGVNTLLRATGACVVANYFYTYGMNDNPLLGMLKNLIPVNLLYLFPMVPLVAAINVLMFLPFKKRITATEKKLATPQTPAIETEP